jgi:hypothetical protein
VEAKCDTEGAAAARDARERRRLTLAVAVLHTSQRGSGHSSCRKRVVS